MAVSKAPRLTWEQSSLAPVSFPSRVDEDEESNYISLSPSEDDEFLPLGQQTIVRSGAVGQSAALCFRETIC